MAQKVIEYDESPQRCDMCQLDVKTANFLDRASILYHQSLKEKWRRRAAGPSFLSSFLCPPLGSLRIKSPMMSYFSLAWMSFLANASFAILVIEEQYLSLAIASLVVSWLAFTLLCVSGRESNK